VYVHFPNPTARLRRQHVLLTRNMSGERFNSQGASCLEMHCLLSAYVYRTIENLVANFPSKTTSVTSGSPCTARQVILP
jgi:hypothetical protein